MLNKFRFLPILAFVFSSVLHAQVYKEGRGLMYGKTYVYSLKAPIGWILDNEAGVPDRIRSVFYKEGESWKGGDVTAYTKATVLNDSVKTIDDVVKVYTDRAKAEGADDYEGVKAYSIQSDLGNKGQVYYFASKKANRVEAICFYKEKKTVNAVILKAKNKESFLDNIEDFKALSKSYYYVKDEGTKEVVQKAFKDMVIKEQEIAQKKADAETAKMKAEFEEKVRKQEEQTQKIINSFFGPGSRGE